MTEQNVTAKNRPLSFYTERALARYLGPDLRTFAAAVVAGNPVPSETTLALSGKLTIVAGNVERHGALHSFDDIQAVVPAAGEKQLGSRLDPAVVTRILDLRRTGASKRSIAKAVGRPTTTVHAVIERAGDPAPSDLVARETEQKRKTIERLQQQLARLEGK